MCRFFQLAAITLALFTVWQAKIRLFTTSWMLTQVEPLSSTIAIGNCMCQDSGGSYGAVTAACCQQQFMYNQHGDFTYSDQGVCALSLLLSQGGAEVPKSTVPR